MAANVKLCSRLQLWKYNGSIQKSIIPILHSKYHSAALNMNLRFISYTKTNADYYEKIVQPSFNRNLKISAVLFSSSKCWQCNENTGKLDMFCKKCKSLQPPNKDLTYFNLFGFEDSFDVDINQLSKKYKELQWQLHPDKFSTKPKEEQEYSEIYSSLVNLAYRTLLQPLSRGLYLLEIKGNPFQDGDVLMDQEFLVEMMDINEKISSATSPEALKILALKNNETMESIAKSLAKSFKSGSFDSIKIDLARLRYYANIEEKIKGALIKTHL